MALTQSDKVTLTKTPPLPSTCCICNFSADGTRNFVDFQMSLDFHGAIVICEACFPPVASLFGYIHESELSDIQAQLRNVHSAFENVQEENGRLQTALDSILSVRPGLAVDNPFINVLASANSDESSESGEGGTEV